MEKHPIENIMSATMESIRDMVDVNIVVGDAIEARDGTTIIPVSKVCFGFVAGGGEYSRGNGRENLPFAGGASAGVTVSPVGFLSIGAGQVRMLSATLNTPVERLIELAPEVLSDVRAALERCRRGKTAEQPDKPE